MVNWISSSCRFCRSWIFTWSLFLHHIYGTSGSFYNLLKTLPLSDLLPSHVCLAADNLPRCARLWEHYCHASHVWPQLCESASSCSAICPRPGSLIREESCGKVCVSLPDVPLSLQLFVRVGPQQQHRGAGDHYMAAGVWSVRRHCGGRNGGALATFKNHQPLTRNVWGHCPLILHDDWDLWALIHRHPKYLTFLLL